MGLIIAKIAFLLVFISIAMIIADYVVMKVFGRGFEIVPIIVICMVIIATILFCIAGILI